MKDIDIRMENGTLTIKGERNLERQDNGNGFHRLERSYGSFARSFSLPESVDPEKIKADYRNGVLTVTMPKKEVAKPRSIKVEVNS
jgi:HSP20 family protein